jgi:4-amino-4-deoxy-L-arabinose transferase-like glycosyltransferase
MPHQPSKKAKARPVAGAGAPTPPERRASRSRNLLQRNDVSTLLAAALLLVLAGQVLAFMVANSRTSDETIHIAAGYSFLKFGDFRMNPEHPPLIRELAAIPLLFMNLRFPSGKDWDKPDEWSVGRRFFYQQRELTQEQSGRDAPFVLWGGILFRARFPILVLSLVLGWFLFQWSREMFGPPAGLLALTLYVFDPNVVAHSGLVTTDLGVTLFMFLSVYALWKYAERPRPRRIVWLGLMIGAAFSSKFTALWLLPILALLALVLLFSEARLPAHPWSARSEDAAGWVRRFVSLAAVYVLAFAVGFLFLLATYRFTHFPACWEGMSIGMKHTEGGHLAYFLGKISMRGWWDYFLVAFAVKSPPGTLALLAGSLCLALPFRLGRTRDDRIRKGAFLVVPVAAVLIITAFWSINIGLRHILPAYPFLFMLLGSIAAWKPSGNAAKQVLPVCLLLCTLWNAVEAVRILPYDLAYFNPFAGGPANGPYWLSDSNIDWGQSTEALRKYVDRMGVPAIYCAFVADMDPWIHGVKYQYVPGPMNPPAVRTRGFVIPKGTPRELLAVEVMVSQGLYLSDVEAYSWLNSRVPIDRVGYSILIYDISRDDMAHVHIAYGCYGHELYNLAAHEARRALEINPSNQYATRLLATLAQRNLGGPAK